MIDRIRAALDRDPAADVAKLAAPDAAGEVVGRLKEAGYRYVTLDLEGYRTGSMNETLAGEGDTDDD